MTEEGFTIDDLTWNDLELDAVFTQIDRTVSALGEEVLRSMLHHPAQKAEDTYALRDKIRRFGADEALFEKAKRSYRALPKLTKISVFAYLNRIDEVPYLPLWKQLLPIGVLALAALSFLCGTAVGILCLLAAFSVNTVRYFRLMAKIRPHLICFAYIARAIKAGAENPFADQEAVRSFHPLTRGLFVLGRIEGTTANGGSGSPFDLFVDLLKMGFHFDILKFYRMVRFVNAHFAHLTAYLYELGQIDAVLSVWTLRKERAYCEPEFTDEKRFCGEGLLHPLLSDPVPNSIDTKKNVLLTGSNASGKSTFLKTIALNALFAQSLDTVFGERYRAPYFRIISSMSHRDSITQGDSYYIAEVKAMKRILELFKEKNGCRILCFVDEILSGTNTTERISAGTQILRYLSGERILTFAATHDRELTDALSDDYENYHFREDVTGSDLSFSYKLLPGRADTRNAIKLLSLMDFPEQIVKEAEEMANRFDKKEA